MAATCDEFHSPATLQLLSHPCLQCPLLLSPELDIVEPPAAVAALITAFEGLRSSLVTCGMCRTVLLQEAWASLLARALTGGCMRASGWAGG